MFQRVEACMGPDTETLTKVIPAGCERSDPPAGALRFASALRQKTSYSKKLTPSATCSAE